MNTPERLRATEDFLHTQIPLTRAMAVRVESFDGDALILSAPLAANHNHLGTAFGGSLAALAMLAGYGWLWLELDDRSVHIVVSESRLQYLRPVTEELRAICRRPEASGLTNFKNNLAAKGKARLPLEVTIESEGEIAVEFTGAFVAKR